jgi:hypothetical protein
MTLRLRACLAMFHNDELGDFPEVCSLADTKQNPIIDLVREARERLTQVFRARSEQLQKIELEFHAHSEQLQRMEMEIRELRERQQVVEAAAEEQLAAIEQVEFPAATLEDVLGAVRNLITCTMPEQVLQVLTEEAAHLGVRAAVFDVRGKAAWGAAASGFGEELTEKDIRSLIVPLNQANPFRQVYETGGDVEANAHLLKRNRNVLEKLRPHPQHPILLEPIRSAGAVSAILYADPGSGGGPLPLEALKILSEFASAQLDRLMALSGESPAEVPAEDLEAPVESGEKVTATGEPPEPWEVAIEESAAVSEVAPAAPAGRAASATVRTRPPEPAGEEMPAAVETLEETPAETAESPAETEEAPAPAPSLAELDLSQLDEADQRLHKDARRFARLLVSEIELYNKAKVADGRQHKDLYRRLKSDIDRSRQTFEKRFGKTLGSQFDYFDDELVKTLAANDRSALGSEYPEPAA